VILRAGIAFAILALIVGGYSLGVRWQAARMGRGQKASPVLRGLRRGVPAIIYFWSETCAPCRMIQSPALEQIQVELGPAGVQVVTIDALANPQIADEWGVLGLPTTFIIDRRGQPRRVNHGVVRADQLRQQIRSLG